MGRGNRSWPPSSAQWSLHDRYLASACAPLAPPLRARSPEGCGALSGRGKACSAQPPGPIKARGGRRGLEPAGKMVLSDEDKARVRNIWSHVSKNAEAFGSEALTRLFAAHPSSKTYFSHFDLSPGSADIKMHGKKVVDALTEAVNNLDDVAGALSKLSDVHASKLRVDPVNFHLLGNCILITIAAHNNGPLKAEVLLSLDKFLCQISKVLFSKYR